MFGKSVKVKLDRDLYDRLRKIADVAGYATTEEFIEQDISSVDPARAPVGAQE